MSAMFTPDNSENIVTETCVNSDLIEINIIADYCQKSTAGKLLPDAFYIHILALHILDPLLQKYERLARDVAPQGAKATLVKFSLSKARISYLFYPDFDIDPHPALHTSIQVDLNTLAVSYRDYRDSENPPILHRKETFVTPDYPLYEQFAALTQAQEALGLLDNTRGIGTRDGWLRRLETHGVEIHGHNLIQKKNHVASNLTPKIQRHKAAIVRHDLSRPVRLAWEAGLFTQETTFFDYGCGHGGDVRRIGEMEFTSAGWDPYYSPHIPCTSADIVNLGFVINVIEDQSERREALVKAWELTQRVLLVSAQVLIADSKKGVVAYGDGVITNRNTFQKYYEQEELKIYIDQVLNVDAIPVALGVYFVFRDEAQAQLFRASRFRSRATTPKVRTSVKRFAEYQQLLQPLMAFVTERGRLPGSGELEQEEPICAEFGSLRRAFNVILQATNPEEWEAIAQQRRQDLMVYLALCQFSRRPKFATLAPEVQEDILGLFGSYKQAWLQADEMLHSLGNTELIIEHCQNSKIGKVFSSSLWVHISALQSLDPILRLYEGCASRTIGRLEAANVIKFHTKKPKISYLFYPEFDTEAHPLLLKAMEVDLRDLHVTYREYDTADDPPILHCKDALVTPDYYQYEKLVRLTRQEEDWGLFDDWRNIGNLSGWQRCLREHCAEIKHHKLTWMKDADPYKVKLLKSAINNRRKNRHKVTED
ncbi:hypothetical protein B6N60_02406 [Richelia sinica FACHB-800]|uniref:DNA phosphorothioation-associated methyltransferase n=2 Tax=Richelia TaxID=98443 RepID=A0A975Y500_9NOST|nr:hypothetical protein B6N60_02406 [Richelia sinica FACHB-800]